MATRTPGLHLSHWGAYETLVEDGKLVAIEPFAHDPEPAALLGNVVDSARHRTRVAGPAVRKGWLEHGPGPSGGRGSEPFVAVDWDTAIELLSAELRRVYGEHGPTAVYGGSYGWASAGRFHHAQSQVHRFLNCLGGFTTSVDSYSNAAGSVILPRVIANADTFHASGTHWKTIAGHTDILLAFGGLPMKNLQVSSGGVFRHRTRGFLERAAGSGTTFIHVSPQRDDVADSVNAEWIAASPGSDVAIMLALAHTLISERLHDRAFLDRYCVGFERLERYILGLDDGQPKSPEWAEPLARVPAGTLRDLALRLAGKRVFITTTWSLQRSEFGEQSPWMAVALASILGQIGLPGGGYGFGYGSVHRVGEGSAMRGLQAPTLSQGRNGALSFIPVARITDMLLHPGEEFDYNGGRHVYPDIRLVYWAGGNLFHHHQHLGRLRRGLERVDTVVVHEPYWTAAARQADIVIPSTMTLERNDIGGANHDAYLAAMHQVVEPYERARNDYDTFADLASALGVGEGFTEGLDEMGWLRRLYGTWLARARKQGYEYPEFDQFWAEGLLELPTNEDNVLFADFRADPDDAPLRTPSGKIELFSETIDGFGYDDCPGHPVWQAPTEWLGGERAERFPLLLIANNPRTRLHSQLDVGGYSQSSKVQGREPLRMHPADAAARGISDGEVVKVYNDRGAFLAGVVVSDALRERVIQISTGAWYDPLDPADPDSLCVHGNPNVLTLDKGTSKLAQGCVGQRVLVEVERWTGSVPPVRVTEPPEIVMRDA